MQILFVGKILSLLSVKICGSKRGIPRVRAGSAAEFPSSLGKQAWTGIAELQTLLGSAADFEATYNPTGRAVVVSFVEYLR